MSTVASFRTTVVCTEVNKAKRSVSFSPVRETTAPFPVTALYVDADEQERQIYVQSADELIDLLSLDSTDFEDEIEEYSVDGIVYCTLCPYALEMGNDRQLMFASSREELDRKAVLACDCI